MLQSADGDASAASGPGDVTQSKAAASRQIKLSQQVSEFRAESVEHALFKLDAEQATQRVNFIQVRCCKCMTCLSCGVCSVALVLYTLQAYIPDNMKIDHRSLTMLSMLERLLFKAELIVSLMDKYYGPEVAVLEGADAGKTALFSCQVCQLLIEMLSAVRTLQSCLRTADPSNYDAVVGPPFFISRNTGFVVDYISLHFCPGHEVANVGTSREHFGRIFGTDCQRYHH